MNNGLTKLRSFVLVTRFAGKPGRNIPWNCTLETVESEQIKEALVANACPDAPLRALW